jgi:hypothetical protein
MVFADGFLFPVKELGFWTNPGHWVRVFLYIHVTCRIVIEITLISIEFYPPDSASRESVLDYGSRSGSVT